MSDRPSEDSTFSILVTGAGGMLGSDIAAELRKRGIALHALYRASCDVTSFAACRKAFTLLRPAVVINCAAYTNVNAAESEPEQAMLLNGEGTRNVARACAETGAKLIHVSTDYIFDGRKDIPYEIWDEPNPINAYGKSKLAGELAIQEVMKPETWSIVRTSWLYGANGPNFVKTMLSMARGHKPVKVVSDQIGSPTFTKDLARVMADLAVSKPAGIVHATAGSCCSRYEFANEIFRLSQIYPSSLEPCLSGDFPNTIMRPLNSCLSGESLIQAGIFPLPTWQEGLQRYLAEAGELRL